MITDPTFDRSISLRIQFFDEKFSPEQFLFILPVQVVNEQRHADKAQKDFAGNAFYGGILNNITFFIRVLF